MARYKIGKRRYIGDGEPVYIIAEIGSNFDRSLEKAKQMVDLAKQVGADVAKFQSFQASKIVSAEGFKNLKISFQSKWKKSVYQVYKDAEFPRSWHEKIVEYCKKQRIDFMTAPYDRSAVNLMEKLDLSVYKIGSGEIDNLDFLSFIAKKGKPILLALGASTLGEIDRAVNTITKAGNDQLILMQCVTNYPSPFDDANIKVLESLKSTFGFPVGYSDHTPGHVVPLGAVALGACVIEKHFTDNKENAGPDHPFALDPKDFQAMVHDIRILEKALGSANKKVVSSEKQTVIIQRRSFYAKRTIKKNQKLTKNNIELLRPAIGVKPYYEDIIIGRKVKKTIKKGEPITWELI